jgi:hypothetical protein
VPDDHGFPIDSTTVESKPKPEDGDQPPEADPPPPLSTSIEDA